MCLVRWLVAGIVVMALAGTASAATYYVATTGTNATCVAAQTITTPAQTIAFGVGCLSAGDTLYIRTGTYAERIDPNDYTIPSGASWVAPITIAGYPNETVTISGGVNIQDNLNLSVPVYLVFDNLTLRNGLGNAFRIGGNVNHIRVKNSDIQSTKTNSVFADNTTSYLEVLNCNIHDSPIEFVPAWNMTTGTYGLYLSGNNMTITGNNIQNNTGYGIHEYQEGGTNVSNNVIANNIITGNGFDDGERGSELGGAIISSGDNNLFYNNIVYSNKHGVIIGHISSAGNNKIYNNTIYGNQGLGLQFLADSPNTTAQNNIVYLNGNGTPGQQIVDWGTTGLTADHNLITDPSFVNAGAANFRLQSGSAARDAGITVGAVTTDIESIARPQGVAYDIGAYEFTNAPPSTATATITWADVAGEIEYLIEKSIDGGVTYAALKTVAANTTSTTDNQIVIGTLYCYRVIARNSVGNRAASEPICDTPGLPGRTTTPSVSFVVP